MPCTCLRTDDEKQARKRGAKREREREREVFTLI